MKVGRQEGLNVSKILTWPQIDIERKSTDRI